MPRNNLSMRWRKKLRRVLAKFRTGEARECGIANPGHVRQYGRLEWTGGELTAERFL